MLNLGPRTKPHNVMFACSASSIARLDGAETAARSGTPATSAFWTNSNDVRPDTNRIDRIERMAAGEQGAARDLVHGIVAAHVFRRQLQQPRSVEQPGGVKAAGRIEHRLRGSQTIGPATRSRRR
jgi:hypothetical protein